MRRARLPAMNEPITLALRAGPRNALLAALDGHAELKVMLEPAELRRDEVLSDIGDEVRRVWFPHTAVLSITVPARDGGSAEAATIGREGMAGFISAFGDRRAFTRTVVQVSGTADWLPLARLEQAFDRDLAVRDLCLRYTQGLLAQVLQSVGCGAMHSAEQRLARWLLMLQDRAGQDTLELTHEFLAGMLGVRRATVSVALRALRDAGLVRHERGRVRIITRKGLEAKSCECYRIVRANYDRILPRSFS
jgi:CRP-like cAMP-binding protein